MNLNNLGSKADSSSLSSFIHSADHELPAAKSRLNSSSSTAQMTRTELYNNMTTRRQQIGLMDMRRERIQQLVTRGYTQRDIAKELGISTGLVNADIHYIRKQAQKNMQHYINIALPEEISNSLVSLRDLIREAWKDIEDINTSKRDRHNAIQLVKDCTALRLEILGSGAMTNEVMKEQQLEQQSNEVKPILRTITKKDKE